MRYQGSSGSSSSTDEISWTFNDFILGFLMIIMMMASIFALFSNSVVVDSFINQCEDPNDPSCGVGNTIFGGRQRGVAEDKLVMNESPDAAEESRQESLRKWAGIGDLAGTSEITYGIPTLTPQKENIVFQILPDGSILYRNEVKSVEDLRKLINSIALEKGVYLEAVVHAETPFETYKIVKNQLWDLTDAEHWRDVAQTAGNADAVAESLARFGTTYVEALETEVLQDADRNSDVNTDFGEAFEASLFIDSGTESFLEE